MYCRNCGAEMSPQSTQCSHCGFQKGYGNRYCACCGMTVDPSRDRCENCGNPTSLQSWNGPANRYVPPTPNPAYTARAIKLNKVALFSVLRSVALLLLILFVVFLPIFQREATLDDISLDDLEKFFTDGTEKTTVNFSLFEDLRAGSRQANGTGKSFWSSPILVMILIVVILYVACSLIPNIFRGLRAIASDESSFKPKSFKSIMTSLFVPARNRMETENWQAFQKDYPAVVGMYYFCSGAVYLLLACFFSSVSSANISFTFPIGPQMAEYTGLSPFIIPVFLTIAGAVLCRFMERLESDRRANKPQTGTYLAYSGICTLLVFFLFFSAVFSPMIQYKYVPESVAELEDDAEKEQFRKQKYVTRNISLFEDLKSNGYQIVSSEDDGKSDRKHEETLYGSGLETSTVIFVIMVMIPVIALYFAGRIIRKKIPTKWATQRAAILMVPTFLSLLLLLPMLASSTIPDLNFRLSDICGVSGYIVLPIVCLIGVIFTVVMKSREKAKYDI